MKYRKSVIVCMILSVSGGFMNIYSYLCNDGVFASMQTGNILLLIMSIINGNTSELLRYICPILLFIIGVIISSITNKYEMMMLLEAIILIVVCYIGDNIIASSMISLVCGIQLNCSNTICNGTTTMCTGNLKNMVRYTYLYIMTKDIHTLYKSIINCLFILSFIIGIIIGDIVVQYIYKYALLICSDIIFISFFIILFDKFSNKAT